MHSSNLSAPFFCILAFCLATDLCAEQAFLENRDLNGQVDKANFSSAWNITDDGLRRLRSYVLRGEVDIYMQNQVRSLNLDRTLITDEGLKHFEGKDGLVELRDLSLADTRITDSGLESLASLANLQRLNLGKSLLLNEGRVATGVRITHEGIKRFRAAMPDCQVEHEFISLKLSEEQRELYDLWSQVAEVNLSTKGNIDRLIIFTSAKVTPAHNASLPQLAYLAELHGGANFKSDQIPLLAALPKLHKLCLRDCRLVDEAIAPLEKVTSLQVVDLASTSITDQGLRHFEALKEVKAVDLRGTDVRTKGLQSLQRAAPDVKCYVDAQRVVQLKHSITLNDKFELKSVSSVGFRKDRDTLLMELAELRKHPSLEQLGLRHCETLQDDDLALVAKMSNLRELDLGNTKITNNGICHLSELKHLEKLNLWNTKITGDGGLLAVEKLPKLWSLELDETRIDDSCLPILARMGGLAYLELWHTNVTREGVARLQEDRLDIEIKSNPRK